MSDLNYMPVIEDMTWSYSRIESYEMCPYQWFMRYICDENEKEKFYASYGSFMHSIIGGFYSGKYKREDLPGIFLTGFSSNVKGERPSAKIVGDYISMGADYLGNFVPFEYDAADVEKFVSFDFGGYRAIGFIDLLIKQGDDYIIVDHKSRDLKNRSRSGSTKNDKDIDLLMRQLYFYSHGVKEEFGKYPKKLILNCFRNGNIIEEEFSEDKANDAVRWAKETVDNILKHASDFRANREFFKCSNICGFSDVCEVWTQRGADS